MAMSLEEKARAYDEALEKAKFYYGNCPSEPERKKLEKMFPVLCKSEDEKIIQFFAELATDACGGPGQEYYEELGLNYDKVMAWLEKQKEYRWHSTAVKDGDDDEKIRKKLIALINWSGTPWDGRDKDKFIAYLTNKKQKEQKPAWSEEDEDFINMLILHFNYLIDKGGDSVETYKSYREKLKSLHPQPKQEWSEEDEKMRNSILDKMISLDNAYGGDGIAYGGEIAWLKSFRRQRAEENLPKDLEEAANRFAVFYDQGTCDGIAQDCFIAGAKWDRSQMMQEAVEGTITCHNLNRYILVSGLDESLTYGDKVRIIVIPNTEEK